jgi:ferric-dicitrate binding protein FerR (iron transport regulator)
MSDEDIARVLRAAGPRERAPAEVERAVREHLRGEWREIVAERQGRRRRWTGFALAASIAVAAASGWLLAAQPRGAAEPVATMAVALDDVRARGRWWEGWEVAAAGRTLKAGESLETGANGRAALSLPGIASARLDHDTRVRLASADRIEIDRGTLYVDAGVESPADSRLVVETPAGAVRHVGTQYEVRIDGRAVRLRVREGRVEWHSPSGTVERGVAGEQLTIAADGAISRSGAPRYGESWDWIASTTPAIDIEGRPLAEFLSWAGRELGREVAYESPGLQAEAAQIVVHGSVAGLTPAEALDAVLATTSVRGRLDDGRILVSGGRVEDATD